MSMTPGTRSAPPAPITTPATSVQPPTSGITTSGRNQNTTTTVIPGPHDPAPQPTDGADPPVRQEDPGDDQDHGEDPCDRSAGAHGRRHDAEVRDRFGVDHDGRTGVAPGGTVAARVELRDGRGRRGADQRRVEHDRTGLALEGVAPCRSERGGERLGERRIVEHRVDSRVRVRAGLTSSVRGRRDSGRDHRRGERRRRTGTHRGFDLAGREQAAGARLDGLPVEDGDLDAGQEHGDARQHQADREDGGCRRSLDHALLIGR